MLRALCLSAAIFAAGPACAEGPVSVADLVGQLGDKKFARREAAQKELLKRGEGIVPELDRLAKAADAETADRIRKIRYELFGYKDDIRRLLAAVHEGKDSAAVPVSDQLRGLIAGHQPGSGNLLLDILADPKHKLHRQTIRTFVATWDTATADQVDAYIRQSVSIDHRHRPKFPAKVPAMISANVQLREGWVSWPQPEPKGFAFKTRTTAYVDGKPPGKPFDFRYPFGTLAWYRVGEMSEGKHTLRAVLQYEFTQNGQTRKGEIRSPDSTLEILPADTPDDLIASRSEALTKQVRGRFTVRESEHDPKKFTGVQVGTLPAQGAEYHWYPQVTWQAKPGVTSGIHCPVTFLTEPLDVDLCFDAEIHDVKNGTVYPARELVVPAGETGRNTIFPTDVEAFAKGRDGFVTVKVVLKPSRAAALSDVRIKCYYPETITSGELRMKVWQKVEPLP